MTQATADDLAAGKYLMRRDGTAVVYKLTPREMTAYATAKEAGYAVCGARPNLGNVWWCWCEQNNRPYVTASRAKVKYDLLALNRELTAAGFIKVYECMERFSSEASFFSVGFICGGFSGGHNNAEAAAAMLVQLLSDPGNVIDPHALADRLRFNDERELAFDAWIKGRKAAKSQTPANPYEAWRRTAGKRYGVDLPEDGMVRINLTKEEIE